MMIKPLEEVVAKPNQRVIITVIDEFVELSSNVHKNGVRGIFSEYANQELVEKEKGF